MVYGLFYGYQMIYLIFLNDIQFILSKVILIFYNFILFHTFFHLWVLQSLNEKKILSCLQY